MSGRRKPSPTSALPSRLRRPGEPRGQLIPTDSCGQPLSVEAHRLRLARADRKNLELLAQHFGLQDLPDATKWPALCVCLAQQLGIPAFSPPPATRGRKLQWTTDKQRLLYLSVEGYRALGMTLEQACERITDARWFPGNDSDSIERRYKDARRSLRRRRDWPVITEAVSNLQIQATKMRTAPRAAPTSRRAGYPDVSPSRRAQ